MTGFQLLFKFSDNHYNKIEMSTESSGNAQNQIIDVFSVENENKSQFLNSSLPEQDVDNYIPYDERPETYLACQVSEHVCDRRPITSWTRVPIIFGAIFIFGLIGNGTLVYIFIRHKSMRNLPNTFILCLAVGDLLVIVGTVPFISIIYTLDSWPFGEFICKLSEFTRDVSIGITVLTLSVLSFDRYLAIALPFHKVKENCSKKVTIAIVIGLWGASVLFAIPGAYNSHIIHYNISDDIHINICYPFPQQFGQWYPKMIVLLKFLFFYVIPLMTIACFYALMARHLVESSRRVNELNINQSKHIELRTRVAKMVFTLAVIFAICFFPNHIFMLWFYFTYPDSMDNYNTFWHLFKISGYCLTFTNSCLNPVTLYFLSGKFRSHFRRYLFGCFLRKRQLERRPTYRAKTILFYSSSPKTSSLVRQNTNSTKL